jgi:prevent-host-death family protein
MQVSIRELKNHLSKYLHLVQEGEDVIVTSHRKPVVSLTAMTLSQDGVRAVEGVKWGRGRASFLPLDIQPGANGKTVAEMVIEDRG